MEAKFFLKGLLVVRHGSTHRDMSPLLLPPSCRLPCGAEFENLFVVSMAPIDPKPLQDTDTFKGSAEFSNAIEPFDAPEPFDAAESSFNATEFSDPAESYPAHQALLSDCFKRVEKWVDAIAESGEGSYSTPCVTEDSYPGALGKRKREDTTLESPCRSSKLRKTIPNPYL